MTGPRRERLGDNFREVKLPGHNLPVTAAGSLLVVVGMVAKCLGLSASEVRDTVGQGVRVANLVRELIIGIETVCDRRKPKYAINRTILDKNFHKQLILRYIGRGRP